MTDTAPRPTLEAVAARAGVSRATVSRVVNGGDGVREPLVERVRRAVEELGYVPNQAARSLVTRRHDAIAVVIAEPETRVFADPFFGRQLRGISKELTAHDNQLVLLLTEGRDDHARVARYLAGGHVDGALVFSLHLDDPLPALLQGAGVPMVIGGRPGWDVEGRGGADGVSDGVRGSGRVVVEGVGGAGPRDAGYPGAGRLAGTRQRDVYAGEAGGERAAGRRPGGGTLYVDSDNRGGAQAAVRHLVGLGRTRVAHITGPLDQTSAVDRLDGYLDVMGDTDPALLAEGDFTPTGGEHAMRELLARRPDLDAVFAANDLTASGALRVLREQGRRVPEDVAVIGFDDMLPIPEQADPPLTTVRQDIEEMGRLMARLLLNRLARTPSTTEVPLSSVVLPTRLIRRASA
ncbi:LacI family DNA-binding transcriptional regulator [Streptomyces niveiscabiei]|uniref:LacI family DNA-binding transcriptional regulator n=1 Tax=Streptomyces niveiscabiei TaxID=164115 RepID=UPI0029B5ECEC|nr:LacI family DNA-binding transcriptional regulator [Streptomyces niveiscabiei]MDX3381045.1 LacI family DNA-binding transcriptional regulator [Streptomyces niveiscabiei]